MNAEHTDIDDIVSDQFWVYIKILGFLLLLTGMTFIQPLFLPAEVYGTFIMQISIACVKVYLIVAFYMHLKHENNLFKYSVYGAVGVLMIFFVILGIDANTDDKPNDVFNKTIHATSTH